MNNPVEAILERFHGRLDGILAQLGQVLADQAELKEDHDERAK